ncbi:MAG: aspartate kinase [bacterium]|nr:aspartate kinase [bacterium]
MEATAIVTDSLRIVVLKYGGASVATTENLRSVAKQVIACKMAGESPVVVVSAMGDSTDRFLKMAYEITDQPRARELDMLLSVGERISIALLAMAINAEGPYEAISLTGSQVGIITDTNHTRAKIIEVRAGRIYQVLEKGLIPIVAGFQGVSIEKEITTLGRGGSDTTAVALGAALGAQQVRIMKEVDGIFTADPRQVAPARVIDQLNYEQTLEFAAAGSKVLASDSVALARQHGVEIAVGQAKTGAIGTIVTSGDFTKGGVQGLVAYRALIPLKLGKQQDLAAALAFLKSEGLSIHGLHSEATRPILLLDTKEITADKLVDKVSNQNKWGKRSTIYQRTYARISAIGAELEPGGRHFSQILQTLNELNLAPRWFCCSPIRVSFCIPDGLVSSAVRHMHEKLIQNRSSGS